MEGIELVYGTDSLSRRRIRHWHGVFTNGRTVLVDLHREARAMSGRSRVNIQAVRRLVTTDRRLNVRALAAQTNLSKSTVHAILCKDLHLVGKSAKFVSHLLSPANLRQRLEACLSLLRLHWRFPTFLTRVVTMDESWLYLYDPEQRNQSSEWLHKDEPPPQKVRREMSVGKTMLISFFDSKGVVHCEYLRNRTVNSQLFVQILGHLQTAMRTKRPRMRLYLHMDNASSHTARPTKLALLFRGIRTLPHPPYSPDLAPNDFWFYDRLKRALKGRRFRDLDQLEAAADIEMGNIPSQEFKHCIMQSWPKHWERCVLCDGAYFEGQY